jgi:TetR/AcrR family transcriptional regulator, transcriptional repressor for nem operon
MATHAPSTTVRTREGRSTRDAIIAAASRLMHVNGYHGTSLDDVLRESGVGKGNFYYYFKSKEELGHAILEGIVDSFVKKTLDSCFGDRERLPLLRIRCFLDRLVEIHRKANCVGGCALGNLAAELSDVHEGFRVRLNDVFSAWRERLAETLREAAERDELSPDCEPDSVAHFLLASLEGAILMTKLTKDINVMERCVGELHRYLRLCEPVPAR